MKAVLLALLLVSLTDEEMRLMALIYAGAEQQGERYDIETIELQDVQPGPKGGWVCGRFVGVLEDGRRVEPRDFIANDRERRAFVFPSASGEGSDEYYDRAANFATAWYELCPSPEVQ